MTLRARNKPEAGGWRKKQRGMSLVAALFLIVVLAMLGTFAVRLSTNQQQTVNLTLLGSRALAAANAGIEWSAKQTLDSGSCASGSLSLTQGALAGFNVQVTCSSTVLADGTVYVIDAIARYGTFGQPDFVSRHVRARYL